MKATTPSLKHLGSLRAGLGDNKGGIFCDVVAPLGVQKKMIPTEGGNHFSASPWVPQSRGSHGVTWGCFADLSRPKVDPYRGIFGTLLPLRVSPKDAPIGVDLWPTKPQEFNTRGYRF